MYDCPIRFYPSHMTAFSHHLLIKKEKFVIYFFVYCVLSWFSFLMTTGGWTWFFYQLIGGFFFLCIFLLIVGISKITQHKDHVICIDKVLLYILLLFQSLFFMMNYGDCGDTNGSYLFFERILNGTEYYCHGIGKSLIHSPVLVLVFSICYATLLLFLLLKAFLYHHSVTK